MKDPKAFLEEIVEVCKRHGLSISHEDTHGVFVVRPFDARLVQWLTAAYVDLRTATEIETERAKPPEWHSNPFAVEVNGLTFDAWLEASGRSDTVESRAAWRAEEDPTEHR